MADEQRITSDELLARRYDKCIANAVTKGGVGFFVGLGLAILFFRRKQFPVPLATGFGLGMAYAECNADFSLERYRLEQKLREGGR
ncbi:hypothetical protein DFJ74DRAFT_664144 [Hyaloraphidium curvatum]|nr:hypothetical protein DFJ74DRAFT_664144 [Hyaloraphidium curvatum]